MPAAAVPTLTVRVELPPAVTEVGLSEAVAPAGAPLTESDTDPALPAVTAVEIVEVPVAALVHGERAGVGADREVVGGGGAAAAGELERADAGAPVELPLVARYSFVYQKVQSSLGSTVIVE